VASWVSSAIVTLVFNILAVEWFEVGQTSTVNQPEHLIVFEFLLQCHGFVGLFH